MISWVPNAGSSSAAAKAEALAALRPRVLSLYRNLLRKVKTLDPQAQSYYYHFVRQQFNSHRNETEPSAIEYLIERAERDSTWIMEKVIFPLVLPPFLFLLLCPSFFLLSCSLCETSLLPPCSIQRSFCVEDDLKSH
jgi:hypothetical protein